MILDKEIKISNLSYYKNKCFDINGDIFVKIEDLSLGSHIKINVRCDVCNFDKTIPYRKYIENTKNFTELYCCCNKCAIKKQENTTLKNHGVKYPSSKKEIYNKFKKTMLEKYGFEYSFQNKETKEKSKQTSLKNWGTEYPMQNKEIFNKQQKKSCQVKQYKNTNLTYQGLYEKYFIELMEEKGFLNEVSKGKSYNYILNNKHHVYHSDYLFRDTTIEIKSTWTYNKNGKDLNLQLENDTKWKTVRCGGDNIVVLMSKKEIKKFVENI